MIQDEFLQYIPLISIAISLVTVIAAGSRFFVKRYDKYLASKVNTGLKLVLGSYTGEILDSNIKDLCTRIENAVNKLGEDHELYYELKSDLSKLKGAVEILERIILKDRNNTEVKK